MPSTDKEVSGKYNEEKTSNYERWQWGITSNIINNVFFGQYEIMID